jgi:hypothetical protein
VNILPKQPAGTAWRKRERERGGGEGERERGRELAPGESVGSSPQFFIQMRQFPEFVIFITPHNPKPQRTSRKQRFPG